MGNWHNHTLPLARWFATAVLVVQIGQRYRKLNACDVESETYRTFAMLHTTWHALLAIGFVANALLPGEAVNRKVQGTPIVDHDADCGSDCHSSGYGALG